ncbi:MAG: hypothetical protein HQM09_18635 [Candidatus Riflebacteria bacterium]|nr:hypothetical protein [Candidatus Riflebacteria bacterium]
MRNAGWSLVELMVGILILGLALVPLALIQSTSVQKTVASLHEVLATRMATEITEQLLMFQVRPGYARIVGTGDLKSLLEGMNDDLGPHTPEIQVPRFIPLTGTSVKLCVGPLRESFCERRIEVKPLPDECLLKGDRFKVTVTVGWTLPGESAPAGKGNHNSQSVIFLRVD